MLEQLPAHLGVSVLQAFSTTLLEEVFQKLPTALHPLVLQARFPSITSEQHLTIEPFHLLPAVAVRRAQRRLVPALLEAGSTFTALRSLSLGYLRYDLDLSSSRPRNPFFPFFDEPVGDPDVRETQPELDEHDELLCDSFMNMLQSLTQLTMLEICSWDLKESYAHRARYCETAFPASLLSEGISVRLAAALPGMSSLRDLRLSTGRREDVDCQAILESLQRLTQLEHLTLRGVSWATYKATEMFTTSVFDTEHGISMLHQKAPGMQKLASRGRAWGAGDEVITGRWAFGAALARMHALQSLTCTRSRMTERELLSLKQVLAGSGGNALQNLTKLSLSGSNFGNVDGQGHERQFCIWCVAARDVAAVIKRMTALEHVDLSNCNVSPELAKVLAPALRPLRQLRFVDLRNNNMGCEGLGYFSTACKRLSHLSCLSLSHNDTNVYASEERRCEGLRSLCATLSHLSCLQQLDFLQKTVPYPVEEGGSSGCRPHDVVQAIGQHSSLTAISFCSINWKVGEIQGLLEVLHVHTGPKSLEILDEVVSWGHTRVEGVADIVAGLSKLASLTKLVITWYGAELGPAFCILASLRNLQTLELKDMRCSGKEGCKDVAFGLSCLTLLTELQLLSTMNAIHAECVFEAMRSLKKLEHLGLQVYFEHRVQEAGDQVLFLFVFFMKCAFRFPAWVLFTTACLTNAPLCHCR